MAIDPKFIIKIDTSGFAKIHVELTANIAPENMMNLPAFDIRDILRTKFYRLYHRKDTLVTINWLDIETPDSLVMHVFSHFGKVKSDVQWQKIKQEENESSLSKMLNNILSGERQIWMEVDKPIPSYGIIDGRKVKIYHPGQRRTCARCQKTADHCLGNSNARQCEENGGEKIKVEDVWRDILKNVGYSEWSGGKEAEVIEDDGEQDADINEPNLDIVEDFPNCDGIILSNVAEDITEDEIKKILESAVPNSSEGISIHPAGSSKSRLIKDLDLSVISQILKKTDIKTFGGKTIHCRLHVPSTPPKKEVPRDCISNKSAEAEAPNPTETTPKKEDPKEAVGKISAEVEAPKPNQEIPGLSESERKKALKLAEKKKKAALKQERKGNGKATNKQNKESKQNAEVSVANLSTEDFLLRRNDPKDIIEDFVFSDYSTDDDDETHVFEDSKEELSEEEFLTPFHFKSVFGRKQAALSTSTPNLSSRPTTKRSASSPVQSENKKKSNNGSLIPLRLKK